MNNFYINVSSFSVSKPPSDINHRRHFKFNSISRGKTNLSSVNISVRKKLPKFVSCHAGGNSPRTRKISRLFGGVCSGEATEITLKAKTSRSRNLTFATPLTKPLKNQLNRSISSRRLSFELKKRETVLYPCLSTYRLFCAVENGFTREREAKTLNKGIWSR